MTNISKRLSRENECKCHKQVCPVTSAMQLHMIYLHRARLKHLIEGRDWRVKNRIAVSRRQLALSKFGGQKKCAKNRAIHLQTSKGDKNLHLINSEKICLCPVRNFIVNP